MEFSEGGQRQRASARCKDPLPSVGSTECDEEVMVGYLFGVRVAGATGGRAWDAAGRLPKGGG